MTTGLLLASHRADRTDERDAQVAREPVGEMESELRARHGPDGHDALDEQPGRSRLLRDLRVLRVLGGFDGLADRVPVVQDPRGGPAKRDRQFAVRRARSQEIAQRPGPAEPVQPRDRPARLRDLVSRELPPQVQPDRREPRRPHLARLHLDAGPVHLVPRCRHGLGVRSRGQVHAAAAVAAPAPPAVSGRTGQLRVVELPPQEGHPAPLGPHVLDHRALLGLPGLGHPRVPGGVVRPRLTGSSPAALHAPHGPVDVEHLEHGLEPRALEVHERLQRRRRERPLRRREGGKSGPHLPLGRERLRPEPVPDRLVLLPGQQHDDRRVHATPRTAHLLVVRDRGRRCPEVHDEGQVGLVEPHPERGCGHERLDPVLLEVGLERFALRRVGPPGVGGHAQPCRAKLLGHLLGRGHGEAVDDARPLDVLERLREPGDARGLVGQLQHGQVQRLAVERTAEHQHVGDGRTVGVNGELLGDVAGHALVRRRRRRKDGDARRQVSQQGADAAVVGAEVVAPVGDAVRLVDDHEAGVGGQAGQHVVAEARVVEPLGGAQQHVHLAGGDLRVHLLPLRHVRGVDGHGLDPCARGRGDLVAHEGQQRRDDHGGPGSARAQQRRRHEVDGRLAPPRALHHERAAPERDERLDGRPLVLAQDGVVAAHERPQRLLGLLAQGARTAVGPAGGVHEPAQHGELGAAGGVVGRGSLGHPADRRCPHRRRTGKGADPWTAPPVGPCRQPHRSAPATDDRRPCEARTPVVD